MTGVLDGFAQFIEANGRSGHDHLLLSAFQFHQSLQLLNIATDSAVV
jgi:hypothetical protein